MCLLRVVFRLLVGVWYWFVVIRFGSVMMWLVWLHGCRANDCFVGFDGGGCWLLLIVLETLLL